MPTQTFPGRYESLVKIADFVRLESENIGFSHNEQFAIETAVDEAVSNIIEHAYQGENRGEITCTCIPDDNQITIVLEDCGQKFDPNQIPQPDLHVPLKRRQIHGLGMFIMQKWMDEVHFEFCEECNRLIMVKHKEKKA